MTTSSTRPCSPSAATRVAQDLRLGLVRDDADDPARLRPCGRRRRTASRSCPAAPMMATVGPEPAGATARADHPVGEGRRPADVHHRQRQLGGQVAGQPGRDRPAEQDRVPVARDLLGPAVPAGQPVGDHQRGQAERDQRGDLVAGGKAQRRSGPGLVHRPSEHAAGAGDRVLHLAAGPDDVQHRRPDLVRLAVARLVQLAERSGVQVQPPDPDAHLVGPDGGLRIEPPGGLRQHAAGSRTRCRPSGEPAAAAWPFWLAAQLTGLAARTGPSPGRGCELVTPVSFPAGWPGRAACSLPG